MKQQNRQADKLNQQKEYDYNMMTTSDTTMKKSIDPTTKQLPFNVCFESKEYSTDDDHLKAITKGNIDHHRTYIEILDIGHDDAGT